VLVIFGIGFDHSPAPFLPRKGAKKKGLRGTPPCPRQRCASARPGLGGVRRVVCLDVSQNVSFASGWVGLLTTNAPRSFVCLVGALVRG
jgi:hypothetical protein